MDEGDRSTDADESAGRMGGTEGESEESRDGSDSRTTDEPSDDARDGAAEVAPGVDTESAESAESTPDTGKSESDAGSVDVEGETGGSLSETRASPENGADESLLYRFRHDRDGALMWLREMLSSVAVVLLVGLLLFGVSGVWPPMVAVESGSMEPNMQVGDLVFVTEPGRLAPEAADNGVGVVTHEVGERVDYRTFGSYGSVVIYTPPGRTGSPIIHRARFHVTEGENWYDRADDRYHNAVDCESLANCPAPNDGYVTLGDNNGAYDQASGLSPPVKAEWVNGVARLRVPYLGYVRLITTGQVELSEAIAQSVGSSLPAAQGGLTPSDLAV